MVRGLYRIDLTGREFLRQVRVGNDACVRRVIRIGRDCKEVKKVRLGRMHPANAGNCILFEETALAVAQFEKEDAKGGKDKKASKKPEDKNQQLSEEQ